MPFLRTTSVRIRQMWPHVDPHAPNRKDTARPVVRESITGMYEVKMSINPVQRISLGAVTAESGGFFCFGYSVGVRSVAAPAVSSTKLPGRPAGQADRPIGGSVPAITATVAQSAPHGTERGYSLKILCVRSHVSDREFIQFTAEAWSLKVLTGSRVPSGHSASTSH